MPEVNTKSSDWIKVFLVRSIPSLLGAGKCKAGNPSAAALLKVILGRFSGNDNDNVNEIHA